MPEDQYALFEYDFDPFMLISGRPHFLSLMTLQMVAHFTGYGVKGKRSKFPLRTKVSYISTANCADQLNGKNINIYASNFCGATDRVEKCPGNKGKTNDCCKMFNFN